jgi:hypothetical protein
LLHVADAAASITQCGACYAADLKQTSLAELDVRLFGCRE